MICIVFEHCTHVGIYIFPNLSVNNLFYMSLVQLPKLGTISFFVLAGFLIGSKFKEYTPLNYFKRRLSSTFGPWLFWSLLFVFSMSLKFYIIYKKNPDFVLLDTVLKSFETVYLFSNYWFIINFLICIGILLLFRKHLYSKTLGAVFCVFTLIYSVNIYCLWFPPMHTMAIFGFVFFLWLGAQCNHYWDQIEQWIAKISYGLLIALLIVTYVLSVLEIAYLFNLHSIDPYNTLRFSNILYSLVCIVLLLKIRNFPFTAYLRPRETTFGIFLIHYIIVFNVLPEILRPFHIPLNSELTVFSMIIVSLIRFIVVYSLTIALVFIINKTRLKWMIGR